MYLVCILVIQPGSQSEFGLRLGLVSQVANLCLVCILVSQPGSQYVLGLHLGYSAR